MKLPRVQCLLQCITPLLKCDGWSITTVEGVGTPDGLDEVQSRLVSNNGTQCGFCTPGFVMSMNRWVPKSKLYQRLG